MELTEKIRKMFDKIEKSPLIKELETSVVDSTKPCVNCGLR
jgi:hypothetical protein